MRRTQLQLHPSSEMASTRIPYSSMEVPLETDLIIQMQKVKERLMTSWKGIGLIVFSD